MHEFSQGGRQHGAVGALRCFDVVHQEKPGRVAGATYNTQFFSLPLNIFFLRTSWILVHTHRGCGAHFMKAQRRTALHTCGFVARAVSCPVLRWCGCDGSAHISHIYCRRHTQRPHGRGLSISSNCSAPAAAGSRPGYPRRPAARMPYTTYVPQRRVRG